MITLGALAMCAATLGYVLWPLFRRPPAASALEDLEPAARQ